MSKRGGDEEIDWDKVLGIAQAMSKRGAPPVSASWEEAQQLASTMSKRGGDEEIDWDKVLGIAQAVSKRTSKAFEDYVKSGGLKHDSTHNRNEMTETRQH